MRFPIGMVRRCVIFILWLSLLSGIGWSQPLPDDVSVVVRLLQNHAPYLGGGITFTFVKVEGETRTATGKIYLVREDAMIFGELTPGNYDVTATRADWGYTETRPVTLVAGYQGFDWALPPAVAVTVAWKQHGAAASPSLTRLFLSRTGTSNLVELRPAPGPTVPLPTLLPGSYRLTVLTDIGYAVTDFTLTPDVTTRELPIELLDGSPLDFTVINENDKPLPQCIVTFRIGRTPNLLTVSETTDAKGQVPRYVLPVDPVPYTVTMKEYKDQSGTLPVSSNRKAVVVVLEAHLPDGPDPRLGL